MVALVARPCQQTLNANQDFVQGSSIASIETLGLCALSELDWLNHNGILACVSPDWRSVASSVGMEQSGRLGRDVALIVLGQEGRPGRPEVEFCLSIFVAE